MSTPKRTLDEIGSYAVQRIAALAMSPIEAEVEIRGALREAVAAARQEEREALRKWADKTAGWGEYYREIVVDDLFAWLDARSRGEEPKP